MYIDVNFVSSRTRLLEEVLAHPFESLPQLPVHAWHLVLVPDPQNPEASHRTEHIKFLQMLGSTIGLDDIGSIGKDESPRYEIDFKQKYRLRWEEHISFFTYTFFQFGSTRGAISDILQMAPLEEKGFPGKLLCAIYIRLEEGNYRINEIEEILHAKSSALFGSDVFDDFAEVWTAFKIPSLKEADTSDVHLRDKNKNIPEASEFNRILILNRPGHSRHFGDNMSEAGRLLDTVLDLETYRALASLDLSEKDARDIIRNLTKYETDITTLMDEIRRPGSPFYYCKYMEELAEFWNEFQDLVAKNSLRISATRAYDALIKDYLDVLQEKRIPGSNVIGLGDLIKKRVERSKHACETISERLKSLGESIKGAGDLLRTRIDVSLQFMVVPFLIATITYNVIASLQQSFDDFYKQHAQTIFWVLIVSLFCCYIMLTPAWRKIKYSKNPWCKKLRSMPLLNRVFGSRILQR